MVKESVNAGAKAQAIADSYQMSFMSGFHWVAISGSLILFIIFLIGLNIRVRKAK